MTPATLRRRFSASSLVAWHESGHAVVAWHLRRRVERVHLGFARDQGHTALEPLYDPRQQALVAMAGARAERRSPGWLDAFAELEADGDDQRIVTDALAFLPGVSRAALVTEVDDLLRDHWRPLKELARAVGDQRCLPGPEVVAILDSARTAMR